MITLENKKIFIFDLDGTLISSAGIWNDIDATTIKKYTAIIVDVSLIEVERNEVIGKSKASNPYYEYLEFLKDKYQITASIDEIIAYRKDIINKYLYEVVKPVPYAVELISLLKSRGYTLAIATTTDKHCLDIYTYHNPYTKDLDFLNNFSVILSMEDVSAFKPNPEIHLTMLKRLGANSDEALVMEDSRVGIDAALAAEIDCINVNPTLNNTVNSPKILNMTIKDLYNYYKSVKK